MIFWSNDTEQGRGFLWDQGGGMFDFLDPHPPIEGSPARVISSVAPCKRCHGSGHEPPKEEPAWTEPEAKLKGVLSIRIPKAELGWGYESLRSQITEAGKLLGELGYDEKTPPYYIIGAVLQDWLDQRRK